MATPQQYVRPDARLERIWRFVVANIYPPVEWSEMEARLATERAEPSLYAETCEAAVEAGSDEGSKLEAMAAEDTDAIPDHIRAVPRLPATNPCLQVSAMTPDDARDFIPGRNAVLAVSDTRSLSEKRSGDMLAGRICWPYRRD